MKLTDFNALKNFKSSERKHNGDIIEKAENISLIEGELMQYVDQFVTFLKQACAGVKPTAIVHWITAGKHTADSAHPFGRAIDLHINRLNLFEQVMFATLFPFTGIGFYPFDTPPFLHLDIKDLPEGQYRRRMWYRDQSGVYKDAGEIREVFAKLRGHYREHPLENSDC